ncbi:hypothetical protein GCM10010885_15880 [Alicyclobacillus cellulosilyticus]|uniref:HSP20 family protein n=1 Tax=Alicyclobacillus cellulosilyticus TaxID=1003997 RepID=A0A917NKK4_9BACL|nr:Hsp20/alpha crystallin family protein [Alicyclobacillus cellulosilyticus]GGJ07578.1 hypothetical protein GCM10010885_15880 [Alicyclobacillus cellulosilyticus]
MSWVPLDPLGVWRREFGNLPDLFDGEWTKPWSTLPRIPVDVRETPNEVVVTAEIPGLERKEDVQIRVHDQHLHLSGQIERHATTQGEHVFRSERFFGRFSRTVPLPSPVDERGAKAAYRNGVLEVRLPKVSGRGGQVIDVEFH